MTKDPVSARCEMPVALDPDLVDGVLYQVKPGFYTVKSRINTIKFPNHTYPSTDGDEKRRDQNRNHADYRNPLCPHWKHVFIIADNAKCTLPTQKISTQGPASFISDADKRYSSVRLQYVQCPGCSPSYLKTTPGS